MDDSHTRNTQKPSLSPDIKPVAIDKVDVKRLPFLKAFDECGHARLVHASPDSFDMVVGLLLDPDVLPLRNMVLQTKYATKHALSSSYGPIV
jgi:hypothetical protein